MTVFDPDPDEVDSAAIDAACRHKYGCSGGSYVDQVVSAAVAAALLGLNPR